MTSARTIAVFGVWDGPHGGNRMSTRVMVSTLRGLGYDVVGVAPARGRLGGVERIEGMPCCFTRVWSWGAYGESWLARATVRKFLEAHCVSAAWVVNSRYSVSVPDDVPFAVWEPTTRDDELTAIRQAQREVGNRRGIGQLIHRISHPIDRRFERRGLAHARVVCAMSEHTRDRLLAERLVDEKRLKVVWHPPEPAFEGATEEGGDRTRTRDFIFVGRGHDPRKGLHRLVPGLMQCASEGRHFGVTLVGAGTEGAAEELRRAGIDASVEQAGTASEMIAIMRKHRYLIMPSVQEGFGIAAAEALHLGLPVIATRCGGVEGFLEASNAAFLCDSLGSDLGAAILRALTLDKEQEESMRIRATRFACNKLSIAVLAAAIADVTSSLFAAATREPAEEPIYVR